HMIGRESELNALKERYDSGRFEMIPVFGRRRVGKTTLLKEFIKGRNGVYFSATRGSLETNISKLASKVMGTAVPVRISIEDLFHEIAERSKQERYVLIIDEYPNLVRKNDYFSDMLQEFIDDIEGDSKLFLILCGSSISIMKHQILSSKSPIYGRRTGQLEISQMDIWDSAKMLRGFSDEDIIRIYGMVGGVPMYLKMFDPKQSVEDNIRKLFFEDTSFFRNEHEFVLMEEFDNPFTYYSVLEAVSSGKGKVSDIASYCSLDDSTVHKHLASLLATSFVERIAPVDNPDGKNVRYRISDNFLRFQFRRILPVVDYYDPGNPAGTMKPLMEDLNTDLGRVFEEICSQHMSLIHKGRPGRWWGPDPETRKQEEIDIVLTVKEGRRTIGWFAECKYKNSPAGVEDLAKLRKRASLVRGFDDLRFVIY
ncbi:MAG: ATP-binding protein, partial [Candidatus Methanomethylophilaceae archaeon]|nr:ATP-binding protein [Candidatus Methanomethylophilaceae archaeon]